MPLGQCQTAQFATPALLQRACGMQSTFPRQGIDPTPINSDLFGMQQIMLNCALNAAVSMRGHCPNGILQKLDGAVILSGA
ncbi:hypothetical protein RM96_31375 [Cupriavidus sp. IDO]|nr:hypothetical protein RM96_31375 [Cupriavidus sp. IDO]